MKEYLKMADVTLSEPVTESNGCIFGRDFAAGFHCRSTKHPAKAAHYVSHAINSHDELVEMNKELLAALELMLLIHDEPSGFCGKFGKELDMAIEGQKEKIDTRIAVARNAIAKAKAAS